MRPAATPLATRTLDRCLACGGTSLRALPLRYQHRGTFPLVECRRCGMRFLAVQPVAESLAELYGAEYFERDFRCGRSEATSFDPEAFRDEHRALLEAFEALTRGGRLLEVGCAGGGLLRQAADRGWDVRGVEVSAEAVRRARALGLEVFHGDLADAQFHGNDFDLVYMGDVLEHVPDCRTTLAEVARVLKPAGFLYLRGPITTHSLARRIGLSLYGRAHPIVLEEPPYHLWEFTPGSLQRLVAAVGLSVVSIRQSKIPPGRPHGRKRPLERLAMNALDAVNLPLTRFFNVLGDRLILVAQKR